MKHSRSIQLLIALLMAALSGLVSQRPAWGQSRDEARAPETFRQATDQIGFDQRLGARVSPELRFRDDRGAEIRLGDYLGRRPIVLALVYYRCPLLCNQVLNALVRSLRAVSLDVGTDYDVVAVSIDPEEGPDLAGQKKAAYVGRYDRPGSEGGWHFLVGEAPPIAELARTVGFRYRDNPRTRLFAHAAGIVVLTPDGRVSQYFYGIEYPFRNVEGALKAAGAGRVGSPIRQLLLLCYDYDAATGQYTLSIVRLLRILGTLTALGLGGYLLRVHRRGPAATVPAR